MTNQLPAGLQILRETYGAEMLNDAFRTLAINDAFNQLVQVATAKPSIAKAVAVLMHGCSEAMRELVIAKGWDLQKMQECVEAVDAYRKSEKPKIQLIH